MKKIFTFLVAGLFAFAAQAQEGKTYQVKTLTFEDGDYNHQLAVYVADESGNGQGGHGHNGSNNFCVHYGYKDNSGYSASNLPVILFKDNQNHMIEEMYINNTTYFVNCITNGNGLTSALEDGDYVKIQAIGYKADGTISATRTFDLANSSSFVNKWTRWDLRKLGEVNRVEFNVIGTNDNGYGFSQPAYFCYDDVKVRMPLSTESASTNIQVASRATAESSSKVLYAYNDDFDYGTSLQGDVPEGATVSFEGDNELHAGETEYYTIKGLPKNILIKSIVADVSLGETLYSDMEIVASLGEKQIANLNIVSFLSKLQLPDSKQPQQSEQEYDMKMLEDANTPGSGDLVFKLSSINGVNENEAQGCCYKITYEIAETTGITDVNATSNVVEVARFTADGKHISAPQKGINIVRMSDGTTRKVVVK